VRGREPTGEPGRLFRLLPKVLFTEFVRPRGTRCDCVSGLRGVVRLVSEFCRESPGNSSPKKPWSFLWNPRLMLDLDPELLTVVALATEGRRSSPGNPIVSSLPLPGRGKPGESCATFSSESLKKLPKMLEGMTVPFAPPALQGGGVGDVAVGGFRDMDGILLPEVSKTASSLRWSQFGRWVLQSEFFLGLCAGSLGGGIGGTVPGEISDSLSTLPPLLALFVEWPGHVWG
jgi:hypothetical protein